MKVLTVVGARPQFIKAAILSKHLRKICGLYEVLLHTGQHYDDNLSDIFFKELEMPDPDYNLDIGSGTQSMQTGKMLGGIEKVLCKEKPGLVLVYGDTNSTLAGALAAAKLSIPVAHVEAGLRSFNRRMPEEINRVVTDTLSSLLFVPTSTGVKNLENEGIKSEKIFLVGDVMLDSALYYGQRAERNSRILERLGIRTKDYILCTIHRAENTNSIIRLKNIIAGLEKVAQQIPIIMPLHPRTGKILHKFNKLKDRHGNLCILKPVGYLDMLMLEKNARLIATDSGGVQKEAFFFKVPCVTLRDETEWMELVLAGWNKLISPHSPAKVAKAIFASIGMIGKNIHPYGDGNAAGKIVKVLKTLC